MHTVSAPIELKQAPIWARIAAGVIRRLPAGRYRAMYRLCKGRDQTFIGKMLEKFGGFSFECSLRDNIAREVFFTGSYEPQETAFVQSVLRPGMSFVDVGSNWGFFALMAAHLVGPGGNVVAMEPDPRVFRKLQFNVRRNVLKQVAVFEVAVTDREGTVMLAGHNAAQENCGTSRLIENGSHADLAFQVRSCSLDSLLDDAGLDCVDLLKIDVEGSEDLVLAGMDSGLSRNRYRRILLELHPLQLAERGLTVQHIMNGLNSKGYKGYALDYSPAAFRRACYNPGLPFADFLRPLKQATSDQWPHTIWLSPDQPDLD